MIGKVIKGQSQYRALIKELFRYKNSTHANTGYKTRYMTSGPLYQDYKITKLEDLNKVENLEDIDPQLIKKLIDERTDSLNAENELKILKQLDQKQKLIRKNTLRPFIRPAWILFIMSSTVYMVWQFYWWHCEYDRKENELQKEINKLEAELQNLLDNKSKVKKDKNKPWYKRYFWF